MIYDNDPEPTNKVRYLVYKKDGTKVDIDEGPIDAVDLPQVGDGKFLGGIGCSIVAIAATPLLPFIWHVIAKEH